MKIRRRLALLIAALLPFSQAYAVNVTSLYQAEVPAVSQADDVRVKAAQAGLLQVLVKASGQPDIALKPGVQASLQKADHLVQEFTYEIVTDTASYLLKLRYDPTQIQQILKTAGVPLWSESRPLVLVWLASTNAANNTQVLSAQTPDTLVQSVQQQGQKYGLPLVFPMMDTTDLSQVSVKEVMKAALPILTKAGKRYSPDAMLIGNVVQNGESYQSEWELVLGSNKWNWSIIDKSREEVVANALTQVSQTLAKQYVIDKVSQVMILNVEVSNINQKDDLAQLMRYLKQLTPVRQVHLAQLDGDKVGFAITVRGTLANFEQHASLGQHLVLKASDEANNKLIYDWAR